MEIGIKAVVFDFGGVLVHQPNKEDISTIAEYFEIDTEELISLYAEHRPEYDGGLIDQYQYWSRVAESVGKRCDAACADRLHAMDVEAWASENSNMVAWAGKLKTEGYRTAVLSNMPTPFIEPYHRRFPWLLDFDHRFYSGEIQASKPGPAIYLHCLTKLGLEGRQCVFIDDNKENVTAAKKQGFYAFHFSGRKKLSEDIQKELSNGQKIPSPFDTAAE